jgi:beta-lactam-binding protein with PASTA domain/Tol biopolymer transport system component
VRTCPSCGRQNPDDLDFCECGEYLRWDPTSMLPAAAAPAASSAAPPDDPPAPAPAAAATGAAPPPQEPPAPTEPPVAEPMAPDAVALTLRRPEGDFADGGGTVTIAVEPGGRMSIQALVRNQSSIVDNYDIAVVGLPDGWWSVSPPTVYLVPMGARGTYEQEVEIRVHPPRTADAQARTWPFDVVVTSRAHAAQAAAAPANVEVVPYHDLRTDLQPDRRRGRRKARFTFAAENRANAHIDVAFTAADADGECRFHFAQPAVTIAPGERVEVPLVVRPPRNLWIGRPIDRQFEATAQPHGADAPLPPRMGTYRQRPWLPAWLAVVVPLLVVAAAIALLLAPKKVTVPDLTKASSRFAVEQKLVKAGLNPLPNVVTVTGTGKPGAIIAQTPAAGKKARRGSKVTIQVVVGSTSIVVPSVVGLKVQQAAAKLDAVGLKLGEMLPPPPDPKATVGSQIPAAGKTAQQGAAVMVFVVHGAKGGAAAGAGAGAAAGGKPTPVPNLAGKPLAAAAAALAAAKLLPVEVQQYSAAKPGTLVRTVPASGAKLPPGSKVQLIVSAGFPLMLFDGTNGLMSVNGSGGQPTPLAGTSPGDEEATWSADGTHIAYISNGDVVLAVPGKPGSVIVHRAGTQFRDPTFAPAGRVLAVVRRKGNDGDLCVAQVGATTSLKCVADPSTDLGRSVSWSADGREILVAGHPAGRPTTFGLVLYRSSVPFSPRASDWGKGVAVTDAGRPGVGALAGAFSPDGKQLAVASNAGGSGFQLYVTTPDDFKLAKAKTFAVAACGLAWRPDGAEVAVVANPGCQQGSAGQISRFDPSHPNRVIPLVAQGAHPAWQPLRTGG